MRRFLVLAVALAACGGTNSDRNARGDSTAVASSFQGPDPLVLRIPMTGGPARVVTYPNLDSTVWTSVDPSPAPGRVLGFDDEAGTIAMVDARSRAVSIDLRMGKIESNTKVALQSPVSLDGSSIFGVTAKGEVVRSSSSGEWRYAPAQPAKGVFPLRDGSVLVWSERGGKGMLSRLHPPSSIPADSVALPAATLATGVGVGDRLYFVSGDSLIFVQTRNLQIGKAVSLGGPATAVAVTPSGDRIYALTSAGGRSSLVAVDRYHGTISSTIPLHTTARQLRVDPIGRYVLVRIGADSAAIISVAWNRELGRVPTEWRDDLPLVAPDGSVATVHGHDVTMVKPEGKPGARVIANGADDFWFAFWWTGFRPRNVALDQPVIFDSVSGAGDSAMSVAAIIDTTRAAKTTPDTVVAPPKTTTGYTVSFFTYMSEARAQTSAAQIQVGADVAHVETAMRDGVPVYRVILGPYATCAEAQQIARASGRTYWIPEPGCDLLGNPQ